MPSASYGIVIHRLKMKSSALPHSEQQFCRHLSKSLTVIIFQVDTLIRAGKVTWYLTVVKPYFLVHTQYDTGISTVGSASAAVVIASANRPSSPRTYIAQ
jgi:hypothetical protein